MIQKLTANYIGDLVAGYLKAGIIGWIVWFISAFIYIFLSFGTDLDMYRTKEVKGKKLSFSGILRIIIWPWGMLDLTHELVKHVRLRLTGKEQGEDGIQG